MFNRKIKRKRYRKCLVLKWLVAAGRVKNVLFSDEKIFTVQRHHNIQNDRILLKKGSAYYLAKKIVTRSLFPKSVMVWAGITADGKTPLVFVERGVKINAEIYQENILRKVLLPWSQKHYGNRSWTFQQDWAPAHSARTTISLCKNMFPAIWDKGVWPANSCDLNPLDYSVWGIMEKKACSIQHTSIHSLKLALKKAWDEFTNDQLATIIQHFPKRLQACISAKGGHFEHLLK